LPENSLHPAREYDRRTAKNNQDIPQLAVVHTSIIIAAVLLPA